MTVDEALRYIHSTPWQRSRLRLDRTRELLARMGNPQEKLKFISPDEFFSLPEEKAVIPISELPVSFSIVKIPPQESFFISTPPLLHFIPTA